MKRRLIISSYDDLSNPHYAGGGAICVHEVAKRLKDEFELTVITSVYPGSPGTQVRDGVTYRHIGSSIFGPQIGQLFFHIALIKEVMNLHFDYWVESFTPPFSTSFLPIFTSKPVIGLVHMLSGEDMWRKYKVPFFLLESIGLRAYKRFIVMSGVTKKKIQKYNSAATFLVAPNGVVPPKNFKRNNNRKDKFMLFLGRVELDQKGLDLLIEAMDVLDGEVKVKLVIAGTGTASEIRKTKLLVKKLKLSRKIEFVGRVTGKEKDKLLKDATLLVLPSRYETFSVTALEAIAYNLPFVSFDIEGLKWVPDNCRAVAQKMTPESLANTISSVVNDSIKLESISKVQKLNAKNYDWDKIAKLYLDFIWNS